MSNTRGILSPKERDEKLIRIDERTKSLPDLCEQVQGNTAWRKALFGFMLVLFASIITLAIIATA